MKLLFKILIVTLLSLMFFSCRKEPALLDKTSSLSFSSDSVMFDTVFTTVGSTTKQLKVYNKSNKRILISLIKLGKGQSSNFRININGTPAISLSDIEIAAKDSMYIFVKVTVDPNNQNSPLVISDSIIFETNGKIQDVNLIAWGQDAYYHTPNTFIDGFPAFSVISCNAIWTNDKPHVIYGWAVVDSACTLTMQPGTRVYLHGSAVLWVYRDGTLKINGTNDNPVTIQGDRLEQSYKDVPGQWGKIWLSAGSKDNEINYAIIKNGTIGIQIDTLGNSPNPTLKLNNTIIKNMSVVGIYAQGTLLEAVNSVVANCGQYGVLLNIGGSYDFKHCTFANYWNYSTRGTPTLLLNNWYEDINHNIQVRPLTKAYFGNCIIYGNNENEITFDHKYGGTFSYYFDHCIFKTFDTLNVSSPTYYENVYKNSDPQFNDYAKNDYSLKKGSPAIDNGKDLLITKDIIDKVRSIPPDIGAYEY
ncbi:MAG: choice-of-anchor Q domain-containing protein [Bacteroidales bacterium]|nr:choice-of-anchor Q domain-containing protein [Bacteroidales bacterium]